MTALFVGGFFRPSDQGATGAGGTATATSLPAATDTPGCPATATSAVPSNAIAQAANVPTNSAVTFTIPSNGDAGVLIHLNDGRFVAFDATCTHAGCPVQYDPGSQALLCPCHGAAFDPSQNAAVLQVPAPTPLTGVPIKEQNGAILLAN